MTRHARLIIVGGLPGAGKTTLARHLEKRQNAVRLNADDWMEALGTNLWDQHTRQQVEDLQWQLAQRLLELGQVVIVEWGTWARSERDTLREHARSIGAAVELRWMHAGIDDLWKRIKKRQREDPPIERENLEEWAQLIEHPTDEELALFDRPGAVDD